jgi:hypothetical protein
MNFPWVEFCIVRSFMSIAMVTIAGYFRSYAYEVPRGGFRSERVLFR